MSTEDQIVEAFLELIAERRRQGLNPEPPLGMVLDVIVHLAAQRDEARQRLVAWQPVSPAAIESQRSLGWPDFHPEDFCHRCGTRNPLWFTDRETWIAATAQWAADTGREGICCPKCFVEMHEAATGRQVMWSLTIAEQKDLPL